MNLKVFIKKNKKFLFVVLAILLLVSSFVFLFNFARKTI
ncbi:putative membrane protein [Candidatus Phytoplasma solani]